MSERYGVDYLIFERGYYGPAFIKDITNSKSPPDKELALLLAGEPDAEAFYRYARGRAALTWENETSGGFILDLRSLRRPKTFK